VRYAPKITNSVPDHKLMEKIVGPDGKQLYTYFEWLRQTNIPQLLDFEDWLKRRHPEAIDVDTEARPMWTFAVRGKKVSMPGPLPILTQYTWERYAKYYNSFLAEARRAIANRNASLAIRYLIFVDRFPPDGKVKRAIERYLESRKTELDEARELLAQQVASKQDEGKESEQWTCEQKSHR